jgi:hypothetical protein
MNKYIIVKCGKVITRIAEATAIHGYTIGIIEPFFPSEDELKAWTKKNELEWIRTNNKRMRAICKFLNEQEGNQ